MNALAFLRRVTCLALIVAALPVCTLADDRVEVFMGGQTAFSNYFFMGATVALPGSNIGDGFAVRSYLAAGGYDYNGGTLGTVRANFVGAELDGVYQLTRKNLWSDFALGVNDTYTALNPYDPNNILRGQQVELRVTLDGGTVSGPWRADWFGYYGTRVQDYQSYADVTHAVAPKWRLGVLGYLEGNPTYTLRQLGALGGLSFSERSELQLAAGEGWETSFAPRAFVRASFYERF
ncbi:MAG TPA: cellulose biosynthesis protein BcsS [Candidatus Cybelea sp.]